MISIKQIVNDIWRFLHKVDVNLLARHYIICNIFIGAADPNDPVNE